MSSHHGPPGMDISEVNSQSESKLVSVPIEIRRQVYANLIPPQIHVALLDGRLQLSVCVQPPLGDDVYDGREREIQDKEIKETKGGRGHWARRLESSWGPHWICQDLALLEKKMHVHERSLNHVYNLLFVCKKMFLEIYDFVAKDKVINVTDLDTMMALLQMPDTLGISNKHTWNLWDYTPSSLEKLHITLRLPIAFFNALEDKDVLISESRAQGEEADRDVSKASLPYATWAIIWQLVCQLPQLRHLHIWLDHDAKRSWSVIKERQALRFLVRPLTEHMYARSGDESLAHMEARLQLPKLHPTQAKPDTHFVQESALPPFTIERRIRQRYFGIERANGDKDVTYHADFPYLHELSVAVIPHSYRIFNVNTDRIMTLEEVEVLETKVLKDRPDVIAFMQRLSGDKDL